MRNAIQRGERITYTNSGSAISSGDVVVIGNCVGVASVDIANGETGEVAIAEVYQLPKVSGAVIGQGETVNWDVSATAVDDNAATPASGDVSDFGIAMEAAGSGITVVNVLLLPGNGTVT